MPEKYPVVIIPQAIRRAAVHLPEVKHPKPKPPLIKPRPQKPKKPILGPKPKPNYKQLTFGISALITLISFAVGYTVSLLNIPIGVLFGITFFASLIRLMPKQYRKFQTDYQQEIKTYQIEQFKANNYQNTLKNWEQRFKKWQLYNKNQRPLLIKDYQEKLRLYEEEQTKQQHLIETHQHDFQRITVSPPQHNNTPKRDKLPKKGELEGYFLNYLNQYFPDKIHIEQTLEKHIGFPYTADFCYYNEAWNLRIDIEIDEPYSYKDKQPIHFSGLEKDKNRNDFFVANNWVVIRFAEEQIAKQPKSCCKFIAQKLNLLIATDIPETLINEPDLTEIKRWNYFEAQHMAAENYRDNYLH